MDLISTPALAPPPNHPNNAGIPELDPHGESCRVCGAPLTARQDDQDKQAIDKRHARRGSRIAKVCREPSWCVVLVGNTATDSLNAVRLCSIFLHI